MPQFKTLFSDEDEAAPPETNVDEPFPISVSTDVKRQICDSFNWVCTETVFAMTELFLVRRYFDLLVLNSTLSSEFAQKVYLCYVFIVKPLMLK